ncbi:hypothetical protein GLOIN_2v1787544 [Rhizophagus clarus]|uniref:Uncharacterized protein n=1 Tax=Rhizophagus clarus TaxID=94130 RepID=A0A8H3QBF0_9GLOM|nr:hypothetical protein GLOIN_2v1787544 [Rhizophagus clarus]
MMFQEILEFVFPFQPPENKRFIVKSSTDSDATEFLLSQVINTIFSEEHDADIWIDLENITHDTIRIISYAEKKQKSDQNRAKQKKGGMKGKDQSERRSRQDKKKIKTKGKDRNKEENQSEKKIEMKGRIERKGISSRKR